MLSSRLEQLLNTSVRIARDSRHEFVSLEHILLAFAQDAEVAEILQAVGCDLERLKTELVVFLERHAPRVRMLSAQGSAIDDMSGLPATWKPEFTLACHRLLQRAVIQVQSAGRDQVLPGNVLVALFNETESHAVHFLEKQGVTQFDVINFIAHGVAKPHESELPPSLPSGIDARSSESSSQTAKNSKESESENDIDGLAKDPSTSRRNRPHLPLFAFRETESGNAMPNTGSTFSYTFDEAPVPPVVPIPMTRVQAADLRVLAWNVLGDGNTNPSLQGQYQRMLAAMDPDVIGFSECVTSTATAIKTRLDTWLPIGGAGWQGAKGDFDMVIAARWPIMQSWPALTRQFAAFIDLPATLPHDLLFTASHLHCCTADANRQNEADEYVRFVQDAMYPGGAFTLPENKRR